MFTSSFGSFTVYFYYFILLGEFKNYRAVFGQIFTVIIKPSWGFNLFIEYSDFVFIDGESDIARREFKSLAAKVAFELFFFRELVSDISFVVDREGIMEIVEFKFKHNNSFLEQQALQ